MRKIDLNRNLPLAVSALAFSGSIVSGYLTWQALTTPVGSCPLALTGFFGCSAVLSSAYSRIGGVPTAMFGLVWFLAALGLSLGVLRNVRLVAALLAWSLVGLVGIVGLIYIEFVVIGAICPFCTAAHLLGLAIFVLTVVIWKEERSQRQLIGGSR